MNDLGFPFSGNLHIILYHVSYYIHVYPKRLGIDQKRFLSVRTNGPWAWQNLRLSVGMLASLMRLQAGFRHGWSSVMTPFPKDESSNLYTYYIYIYGILLHIVSVHGITWYSHYTSYIILDGYNHTIIYIYSIHITCAIHMINIDVIYNTYT